MFDQYSKTRPFVMSTLVASTWQLAWTFGLGDRERAVLAEHYLTNPDYRPCDPIEARLLVALRARTANAASVYADYLEERGDIMRAEMLRALR